VRATSLALKDLLQIARDWKSALFLVVMPILFTFFFGLVLQPDSQAEADARLAVGVVDREVGRATWYPFGAPARGIGGDPAGAAERGRSGRG
jgi:hypothetical protein